MRTLQLSIAIAAALVAPAAALAGPRADAIARHADADVAALRAELPGSAEVRCTLGAIYAARGDVSRGALYLDRCDRDAGLDADIADTVAAARVAVLHKARAGELSGIDVITDPEGLWAEIDALPGDRFLTPLVVYVPAGHHVITATAADGRTATSAVDSRPHAEGPMMIQLGAPPPPDPHAGNVDFGAEPADETTGPPPDVKHPVLRRSRFVDGDTTAGGPVLEDPLANGIPHRSTHAWRAGMRFGGGVFDHSGADARVGFDAGAVLAIPLSSSLALATRLDWSRRGGSIGDAHGIDAIGVTAGAQLVLARLAPFDVRGGAGLRGAIQLEDTMDTSRATLAAAGWLELPLHATPLTVGVRLEQGLTHFAPGARDRAAIFELGVDFP